MIGAVKEFVKEMTGELIAAGFGVELINKAKLPCSYRGEFDEGGRTLRVAIGNSQKLWFPIAVHEYCHFLQFRDQADIWTRKEVVEAYDVFFNWLADPTIEVSAEKIMESAYWIQALEQDCDRRAVELIKERELPIDVDDYIKRSNTYVWFYNGVAKWRTWSRKAPYDIADIVECVPGRFLTEDKYQKPTKKFMTLLKEKSMLKKPQFIG